MAAIFSRKKKKIKNMRRKRTGSSRYFFYFLAAVGTLALISWGIKELVTHVSFFEIEEIVIKNNENLEAEFLENLAMDFIGKNLYAVSKRDILQKYENIIRIKDISVSRGFPDKIKITVQERVGKFFLKSLEGDIFPIDIDRIVLDNETFYAEENLPIIEISDSSHSIQAGKAVRNDFVERVFEFSETFQQEYPEFINNISEFYLHDDEIYLVEANTGYRIVFGEGELGDKIKKFKFLEQNRTFETGKIVDLRYKDQLVIRSEEE